MKKEEITSRIITIVNSLKTSWVKHEVTPASNLRDEVELESIDFLDMIQQVEMMFHIKISQVAASEKETAQTRALRDTGVEDRQKRKTF